ncbi:hypothetical protein ASPACDRAFT_75793 [Aspergillus aculeatus ATCC 16872]|uniref:RING-type domain-containing protein n=1 Tax=Aspergillus aculeatus (strain ATCC 16872 / CBS 172.66 / WB 5094) TaxID=690307 RepID=A0A1L9X2G0_ASPA1|nr:uncharacterized protein ASPACDRAFT_75793 [Aspergillus aculeatus ATCC 16872]OJK02667.1 hypothetical protein ASPACDRAFT_75793 [Aspergillus aculeatus ATCC 16872]
MSSRQQIDSVIDDDDEFCPLCIEEFDLSDKNFKPCPCGYQICQFCYNNIKTHSEEGRCPNCRRVYDESTIQYKVPDADEFKADLALKHRKAAAAKKKEAEKREIEASSRKNLAGVRVVQKNLVYVIGLNPTIRDESQLLQTLRGRDYFGQYGDIEKIVVSKAKPGGNPNQGIGVYVTYARKQDAATCIAAVDGSANGDRVLRAQYGTTKYCSSFLRNEQCHNRNCTFLHETGEDSDSYSRQDLSSMNTLSSQRPNGAPTAPAYAIPPHVTRTSAQPLSQPMRRQPSRDDAAGSRVPDGPALPSSASWANKDAVLSRARRASLTGSQASQSPRPATATVAPVLEEPKPVEKSPPSTQQEPVEQSPSPLERRSSTPRSLEPLQTPPQPETPLLDNLVKAVNSPDFKFIFSAAGLPAEEIALIENHPSFIDPYGGVKRRAMREKAEQERARREQELLQSAAAEEESRESGSLQLGGEPDDVVPPRGRSGRESHGAIQPPSQQGTTENSTVGSPVSATSHQFQQLNQQLNLAGRSLTPQQQQQLLILKSANDRAAMDQLQGGLSSAALDQAAQVRQGLLQSQMAQLNSLQAQNRQNSRFSFANEVNSKNLPNARMLSQQASLMQSVGTPNPLAAPSPQHGLSGGYFPSGVQGPPPGLKTAGTPPISGGGMFAQGHGFTTNTSLGLGASIGKQEANPDLMRELLRGRNGAGASGLQGQEAAKLDEEFPPLGAPPKDKRPVDSFGYLIRSQFASDSQSSARAGTPTLPPGLPLPHAHPASALFQSPLNPSSPTTSVSVPPGLNPPFSRLGTPSQAFRGDISRQPSPEVKDTPDDVPASSRVKNVSEISLGSPVPKSTSKARSQAKGDLAVATEKKPIGASKPASVIEKVVSTPVKSKPIKLDLSLGTPQDASKADQSVPSTHGPAPISAIGSRPNTPLTGVSRVSDSSAPRQPRVLRVVDTPKTETPPPPSAPQSVSSLPAANKARSRRPSISSMSRPDTPGDFGSEADLYTSASVSRANSPPASSRIGSAPVRAITKSQAKKERRQKAKEAEAKKQETSTIAEEPVQAPIIGRKRKTKKTPVTTPDTLAAAPETAEEAGKPVTPASAESNDKVEQRAEAVKKAKSKEKASKEVSPAPVEVKATPEPSTPAEAWRSKNTVEQLIKDAESSSNGSIKDLFAERTSPLQVLLAQLHKSGHLNLNHHPLFNPTNLNQRFDMKCTSDDYEILKQPIELAEEHRKALLRGEPIRIHSDPGLLKDRCLITPRGCVLRHLSQEEEDRYLALEKSIAWAVESFQEYSSAPITEPDVTNRVGGLDALFATPENFNICWADENSVTLSAVSASASLSGAPEVTDSASIPAPPNVLSAMEADSTRSHNWAVANTAELVNATATSVRSFAAATAKHMLGAAGVVMGSIPDLDDVVGMTTEELRSFAVKSQKDLESSRKELDTIDKKLNALVKRNRKLAQQALATTVEG